MKKSTIGPLVLSLFFIVATGVALVLARHFSWEGEEYVLGVFVLSLLNGGYALYTTSRKG